MVFDGIIDRYVLASTEFGRRLRAVRPEHWTWPTPCSEWNVRQLVNHMTRGNLSYAHLVHGGTNADFLRERDLDALGTDPVGAYQESVAVCVGAFRHPGALDRMLDYPLGKITGAQALAVRTTDSVIHTWDLARATGADDRLNAELVTWIDEHMAEIYADLAESPIANTTGRFFATPTNDPGPTAQSRVLHLMGRA